jgi:hypothetical protein
MSPTQVVVRGTLKPDGTLELEERPGLPAGPVEVIVRSLPEARAGAEDWWQYLQRARAELEALGHRFSTGQEVNAYIEDLRSGDERIEEVYRRIEEEQRGPGETPC